MGNFFSFAMYIFQLLLLNDAEHRSVATDILRMVNFVGDQLRIGPEQKSRTI